MSKQSIAKVNQSFRMKPVWPVCPDCTNFKFDMVKETAWGALRMRERNLRCLLGGFKVGKRSTCKMHTKKGVDS